jgi:hypothetical protein
LDIRVAIGASIVSVIACSCGSAASFLTTARGALLGAGAGLTALCGSMNAAWLP